MLHPYRYQLDPTPDQVNHLNRICGSVRLVYNLALNTKQQAYAKGVNLSAFELMRQLTDLKQEFDWLYDCPVHALQHAIKNLDAAYTNFFQKRADFPNFKKKGKYGAFHIPQGIKVNLLKRQVFIPKLSWVKFIHSQDFVGEIRNATISKTPAGRYFISILVEDGKSIPEKQPVLDETAVGVDVGLKTFAVLSDGTSFKNPKFLFHSLKRLRVEQRTMKRRYRKGAVVQSKNYQKQRLKVARLHEKVANQRKDFLHKTSTAIVKQFDTVCVENLNIKGMLQNHKLARSISDVGWGMFRTMLKYKCEWYGKNYRVIGRFVPSSRECNVCQWHNAELKLKDRTWTCANGHELDRDLNAAFNIKKYGLGIQPLSVNAAH